MARPPRAALGKGLNALLPTPTPPPASSSVPTERTVFPCPIERVVPQGGQPRRHFDQERLNELAASIKDRGLIEPIIVRRHPIRLDDYEIIAGERRWRACKLAGLDEILVIVKELNSDEAFALALIENIQREELNPIELAEAYHRLIQEHDYTHDGIAELVRKSRAAISNTLRLLKLPERVREMVLDGRLTEGHGRTLMGLDDPEEIARVAETILREALSVRATEALIQSLKQQPAPEKSVKEPKPAAPQPPNLRDLEETLQRHLGTMVQVRNRSNNKGSIVIAYNNLDELDRILLQIRG